MKLLWKIALLAAIIIGSAAAEDLENSEVDEVKDVVLEDLEEKVSNLHDDINDKKQGLLDKLTEKLGLKDKHPFKPIESIHNLLKPKPKPPITITKTIKMEVTKQVTRHPYCIKHPHGLKPCVPFKHHSYGGKAEEIIDEEDEDLRNEGMYIEPSASVKSPEELVFDEEPASNDALEGSVLRSKRYIEFSSETPSIEAVKSGIDDSEIEEIRNSEDEDESGRFLFKKAETKTLVSTLWVTKVQKVTDYRVTATLAAQNCYPVGLNVPRCP